VTRELVLRPTGSRTLDEWRDCWGGLRCIVQARDAPSIPETAIDSTEAIVVKEKTTAGRGSLG
jgi:hypothetical protein